VRFETCSGRRTPNCRVSRLRRKLNTLHFLLPNFSRTAARNVSPARSIAPQISTFYRVPLASGESAFHSRVPFEVSDRNAARFPTCDRARPHNLDTPV